MAMTIIGSHESRVSAVERGVVTVVVLIGLFLPELIVGGTGSMTPCWAGPLNLWLRNEQIHSQLLRKEFGHELSLDTVARAVERRGKSP